jgi:hypothetical protein
LARKSALAARELLREVNPAYGANQNIQEGDLPKVTRESATTDAGLSEHQRKTALRVINAPLSNPIRAWHSRTSFAQNFCDR